MNKTHETFSILPPFNNIFAQVIRRGNESVLPEIVTQDVTIDYAIPGHTGWPPRTAPRHRRPETSDIP